MKFSAAVKDTIGISDAFSDGLGALKKADKKRVSAQKPRNLIGSIDLDSALKELFPDTPRWDYGIAYADEAEIIHWVEVHPASSGHIAEVIAKLDWLKKWLEETANKLNEIPRKFVWVSSGSVSLQPGSPQRKLLATKGVYFAGAHYTIGA